MRSASSTRDNATLQATKLGQLEDMQKRVRWSTHAAKMEREKAQSNKGRFDLNGSAESGFTKNGRLLTKPMKRLLEHNTARKPQKKTRKKGCENHETRT